MISSMFVPICNHFHARQANSAKIMSFYGGGDAPLSPFRSGGIPLTQQHKILSQNTRDATQSYAENLKSLAHLGSDRYRDVTDKQMPRQTNTRTELP